MWLTDSKYEEIKAEIAYLLKHMESAIFPSLGLNWLPRWESFCDRIHLSQRRSG